VLSFTPRTTAVYAAGVRANVRETCVYAAGDVLARGARSARAAGPVRPGVG
jgi:hypothetical protein